MTAGIVFAPVRRAATILTASAALALGTSLVFAQAPAPQPQVPAPKQTPRPVQPAQKAPAPTKQPQQPVQVPGTPRRARRRPAGAGRTAARRLLAVDQVLRQGQQQSAGQGSVPDREGSPAETGQFLAGAALIEQQGEEKKLFRITLPLGMQIPAGHPHAARQGAADDRPLHRLPAERLHGGLRRDH